MAVKNYPLDPADLESTIVDNVNFQEGQAANTLNNSARELMTQIRELANDVGWFVYGDGDGAATFTRLSGTSFRVSNAGSLASIYQVGRAVRAQGNLTGTITGSISAFSFSGSNNDVTVAWDSGSLNAGDSSFDVAVGPPLSSVADLPASQTTSGTFALDRIPDLPASQVTSGTFAEARLPTSLSANYSYTGTVNFTGGFGVDVSGSVNISSSSNLTLDGDTVQIRTSDNNELMISCLQDSEVRLYFNGSERLNTESSGVRIAGDLFASSDRRLKRDIRPEQRGVSGLKPVSFEWRKSGARSIGFIAQDVESYFPDLVLRDSETGHLSLNYEGLIPVLVGEVQRLKARVEALEE